MRTAHTLLSIVASFTIASPLLAQREYGFDNTKPSGQPYLSPEESVKRMKVPDAFEVKLFAAEPDVVNPIAFTIDEKGRVWVVENFEYPSRTPPGKAPRDRIIILEDTDGDGKADKRSVFAEGKDFPVMKERADKGLGAFDLASGIEVGHGGVFVGAPPYLWFIENKNDKPGKFEVLLKGFGSQDTHETLNTFQWGPDGRLYGLHGVFTHSDVTQADGGRQPSEFETTPKASDSSSTRGANAPRSPDSVRMNAAVWRYDVHTRKFEIFAEGTSNPWGMDFDSQGNCFLCCCVIPHLFHIVPGGIYKRQAGTSFNPYAYGYLNEICDHTFHKESGWAHAGLLCLDNPNVPEEYRTSVIFGSIHGCSIKRNTLKRNGSTFTASKAPDFLVSGDKNFRPINLRWAPDGSILVIDWHDQNPCHQAKPESWDKEHGRVYRIQRKGGKSEAALDIPAKTSRELHDVALLATNPWESRTAVRVLAERGERPFKEGEWGTSRIHCKDLWALHARLGSNGIGIEGWIEHELKSLMFGEVPETFVWLVRLGCNDGKPNAELLGLMNKLASHSKLSPIVRLELASAAQRFAFDIEAKSLLHSLLLHKQDAADPVIPLMLWYAYEKELAKLASAKTPVANAPGSPMPIFEELQWLAKNAPGNPLITDHIINRVIRRLVATGREEHLAACVDLVKDATDKPVRRQALAGLAEGLKGQLREPPKAWGEVQAALGKDDDAEVKKLTQALAVNFQSAQAAARAYATYHDLRKTSAERAEAMRQVVLAKHPHALTLCHSCLRQEPDLAVKLEAARGLASFDQPAVAKDAIEFWKQYPQEVRGELVNVLKGRKEWARQLLDAVGKGTVPRTDLTDNTILAVRAFNDRGLNEQIEKVWGRYRPTPQELEKLIAGMHAQVKEKPGDAAKGRVVFEKNCMQCHKFDGKGHDVGPALDGADRSVDYLLVNVLDPNRVIGQPYYQKVVLLKNGQVKTGLLHGEDDSTLTLKREQAALEIIQKKDIDEAKTVEKSLMPEGLDKNITPEEFRHLVEYLRRK
jgi:putative membrane-bound dehydrogenase-like protein